MEGGPRISLLHTPEVKESVTEGAAIWTGLNCFLALGSVLKACIFGYFFGAVMLIKSSLGVCGYQMSY